MENIQVLSGSNNPLSRTVAEKMVLVKHIEEIRESVFGASGLLKTDPVMIKLKEGVAPYSVTTARRVPFPLQKRVKVESDRMKAACIIREVIKPTDWCVSIVPVVKHDGSIRICVDFRD